MGGDIWCFAGCRNLEGRCLRHPFGLEEVDDDAHLSGHSGWRAHLLDPVLCEQWHATDQLGDGASGELLGIHRARLIFEHPAASCWRTAATRQSCAERGGAVPGSLPSLSRTEGAGWQRQSWTARPGASRISGGTSLGRIQGLGWWPDLEGDEAPPFPFVRSSRRSLDCGIEIDVHVNSAPPRGVAERVSVRGLNAILLNQVYSAIRDAMGLRWRKGPHATL